MTTTTAPIPSGCIDASMLRSLANMLDRFAAFHRDRGGPAPDAPCLREIGVENGHAYARVESGNRVFRLNYAHGSWNFA